MHKKKKCGTPPLPLLPAPYNRKPHANWGSAPKNHAWRNNSVKAEIGKEGSVGLITYMRTDSLRVSTEAQEESQDVILSLYGGVLRRAKPPGL